VSKYAVTIWATVTYDKLQNVDLVEEGLTVRQAKKVINCLKTGSQLPKGLEKVMNELALESCCVEWGYGLSEESNDE
jgi:hypothetical protein